MSAATIRLSQKQVRELCPSCADKMEAGRIKILKLKLDAEGELTFADENTARVYAGFSKGLCDKFSPDEGLFTRCAETMAGKVDDEKAFCASLHKFCVGKWPAEKEHTIPYEELTEEEKEYAAEQGDGKWVTVNGRHTFIPEGGSLPAVFKGGRESARQKEEAKKKGEKEKAEADRSPQNNPAFKQIVDRMRGALSKAGVDHSKISKDKSLLDQRKELLDLAKQKGVKSFSDEDLPQEQLMEYSNAIRGVEIFSTGTHNGDEYTEQDLDDIVAAFKELDYRPAIKVGHTKDNANKTATPSYGWVRNLRKMGTKLVADFEDMHDSVIDAIRKRQYDRVSSEIYFNLHRAAKDGVQKVYRRALKAVSLLGAEVPAVSNLVPLHMMEFAATEGTFDGLALCELQMEVPTQALVDSLAERVSGLVTLIKEFDMAKNTEQIKALKAQVAEFQSKMDAMKKKKGMMDDMDGDEAVKLSEDLKALEAQFTAATESIRKLEAEDTNAADVASLQKELAEAKEREKVHQEETKKLSERMARIEHEKQLVEIGTRVRACKVPAFRSSLEAVYAYALSHVGDTVKVYSEKDGKTVEESKTLAEVVDALVSQINSQSEKLFSALAHSGHAIREDGSDAGADDPSQELDAKAREHMAKNSVKSYSAAVSAVLKTDTDLAERYRAQLGHGQ